MGEETLESRLNELEIRVSFQDSTISTLDSVIRAQQQDIEALKSRVDQFVKQQEARGEGVQPAHEEPPHY